jgi:hypothetical protein
MKNDFEQKMENLDAPETDFVKHQEMMKISFMSARKSSRIGIIFILIPALVVLVIYLKLHFFLSIDFPATFQNIMAKTDDESYLLWLIPLVFLVLPLLAIIINLLAISHFYINKKTKELIISIRYRIKNIIVLLIGLAIIIGFWSVILFGYVHFK